MRLAFNLAALIFVVLAGTFAMVVIPASAAEVQWIKPEELKRLIDRNDPNYLVVDVQPKGAYDLGHIKGAINFPWMMDIQSPGNLPRGKALILYCDCGHVEDPADIAAQLTDKAGVCPSDDDATDVAEQLTSKFGYKDVKVLEGGWSRWQELGYPVDKK